MNFRKLSPLELFGLGLSKKSERYLDLDSGDIISKRQYQNKKRGTTYTQFLREIYLGKRTYAENTPIVAVKAKKSKAKVRRAKKKAEAAARYMKLNPAGPVSVEDYTGRFGTLEEAVRYARRYKRPVIIVGRYVFNEQSKYRFKRWLSLSGWTSGKAFEIDELREADERNRRDSDNGRVMGYDIKVNTRW